MYRPGQFDAITAPTLLLTGSDSVADIVGATERAAAAIPAHSSKSSTGTATSLTRLTPRR